MGNRRNTLLALALVLAATPGLAQEAAAPQRAVESARPHQTDVLAALAELRESGPKGIEACREELASYGRPVVPTLVALLMNPAAAMDERGPLVDATAQHLLIEILQERSPSEVLPELHDALPHIEALEERRRAVKILGKLGDATSFDPLVELVAGMASVRRQVPTIQRELETALAETLRRDPRGYAALVSPTEELEPLLQCTVARAIGTAGGEKGLAALERMIGRTAEIDRAVLEAIGRLDPWAPACMQGCASMLAWHLSSDDSEVRRFAAASLGIHGGADQLDALIDLLDDPDRRVQRAAQWSVRQISGMDFGTEEGPWVSWLQRELRWYQDQAPQLLQVATEGQPGPAYKAMLELTGHPLFRKELVAGLAPVVERSEVALVVAACTVLVRLGPVARGPLEEALDDRREEVVRAAEIALRSLPRS